jgi:hypothetical protein
MLRDPARAPELLRSHALCKSNILTSYVNSHTYTPNTSPHIDSHDRSLGTDANARYVYPNAITFSSPVHGDLLATTRQPGVRISCRSADDNPFYTLYSRRIQICMTDRPTENPAEPDKEVRSPLYAPRSPPKDLVLRTPSTLSTASTASTTRSSLSTLRQEALQLLDLSDKGL